MKKILSSVALLLAISMLLLVFISCVDQIEEPHIGSLSLTTEGSITRKLIEPVELDITVDSYRVTGTGPSGAILAPEVYTTPAFVIPDLIEGDWTITVEGLNVDEVVIALTTFDISIIWGEVSKKQFDLTWLVGTGTLDLTIAWPDTIATFETIQGVLEQEGTDPQTFTLAVTDATTMGSLHTLTESINGLATGDHTLTLTFQDGEGKQIGGVFEEDVVIYKGITSLGVCSIPKELVSIEAPVISPIEDTFISAQEVTITTETKGALIYYTTNGSAPSSASTLYTEPFTVTYGDTGTTTIKAISVKRGFADSAVTEKTYTIQNQSFDVLFDSQEGSLVPNLRVINSLPYGTLPTPERMGYTFAGWWTEGAGDGFEVTDTTLVSLETNQTLYAKWSGTTHAVTLDFQGGIGKEGWVHAIYGSPMPNYTVPNRTGYTFVGYFTEESEGGIQYYDGTMASLRNWDILSATTLYAH